MILKSLKLNNIRSYIDEEIKFPEGSVLLSGDIGAGKSTILMAIEFALFGIMRAEFSGNSVLRNGKSAGYVELNFNSEGKEVTIRRALKRQKEGVKQDAGFIAIDGVRSDLTPQELKAKIISLIGYPEDVLSAAKSLIFRYTVYTPQEDMKKIIFDDPAERLTNLRKIFGIEKYKTIASNAEIIAKKIGEEKRILAERITDLDEKLKQKQSIYTEAKILADKLIQLTPNFKKTTEIFENKKEEIAAKEKRFADFINMRNELQVLKVMLSEKETHKKKLEIDFDELKREMDILSRKAGELDVMISLESMEKDLEEEEKQYFEKLTLSSTLKSKEAELSERIKNLKEEISEFEKKIKENQTKSSRLNDLKKFTYEKESMEVQFNGLKDKSMKWGEEISAKEAIKKMTSELKDKIVSMEKCPLCCQTIFEGQKMSIKEDQEKMLAHIDEEIKEFLSKKNISDKDAKEMEKRLKELIETEKEIKRLEGELSTSKFIDESFKEKKIKVEETEKLKEDISKKIGEISGLEKLHGQIKSRKEILKKAKDIETAKKMLADKNEIKKKLDGEIIIVTKDILSILDSEKKLMLSLDSFKNCDKELENSKKELEDVRSEIKKIEMEKLSVEKDIENNNKLAKTIDSEIEKKQQTKEHVQKLGEKQSWLREKFVSYVKLVESHILQKLNEEFDRYFRQWVSVLLEDETLQARIDEEFTPKIEQNGFEMEITDFSGGEKTSFALAYRLALNKVINDVLSAIKTKDLLILDEPTDGFSSEQLDKLRDVLEQLDIAQVIIVSHEAKLESFVQSIIRIDKSHHVSRVLA